MVTISNFSSVLEIAFAINALFYIFDFGPLLVQKIEDRYRECKEIAKKKAELTKNHEVYPIDLVLSSTFMPNSVLFKYTSVIFSFLSLAMLIFTGFYPDSQISSFWMIVILLMLFATPFFAYLNYLKGMLELNASVA